MIKRVTASLNNEMPSFLEVSDHLKEVSAWLDRSVCSYPTPLKVTLSSFSINLDKMTGCFQLTIDDFSIPDMFNLSLGLNGWMQHHPPMFYSPLGAPASYAAIDLTSDTNKAISSALKAVFPQLKPLGLDQETKELITGQTPLISRIYDASELELVRLKISNPEFAFSIKVASANEK
jgi:hypothetical protein